MEIPEDILEIMLDTLVGTASEEETRRLQEWLEEAPGHRAGWRSLCTLWYSGVMGERGTLEEAWEYILGQHLLAERRRRRRRVGIVAAAAAVALLVAVPFLFRAFSPARELDIAAWVEQRQAGQVELVLADGRHVSLERPAERWEGHVRVSNDSTGVRYRENDNDTTNEEPVMHTLIVPRGGEYQATLSDGTVVELNAGTTLRFPSRFAGTREVWLSGEAYFRVSAGEAPFTVYANRTTTVALGTGFNVAAYPDDRVTGITLLHGVVEVSAGDGRAERLAPGYRLSVNNETLVVQREKVEVEAVVAWRKGILRFDDLSLEELMRRLERWYDVPFAFRGQGLERKSFSGGIKRYEPLDRVLHMIGEVNDVAFRVENDTIMIYSK
jgi:ferric-dicitrate binding protein FerR (iron transport regulator)